MAFIELPVDNVNSQDFNVSFAVHLSVKICCSKNAEAAENDHIVHFLNVFQRFVTHSRVALEAHQAVKIKAGVCCVRERSLSVLVCIILAAASVYKIFYKSKVFSNFF
jgi:hypothetical protein